MKKLVENTFKTLFFYDLAVIIFSLLPIAADMSEKSVLKINALRLLVVGLLTFIFYRYVEKNRKRVKTDSKKLKSNLVLGFAAGVVIPLFSAAVFFVFKKLTISGFNPTKKAYIWILTLLIDAVYSELLLRGYLFKLYRKDFGFIAATVITTLLFAVMNIPLFSAPKLYIANILLLNIFLCVLLEITDSVVTTITARFLYTLLSTFLLGSLSLETKYPVFFRTAFTGGKFFGGQTAIEGSVPVTVITALFIILFLNQKYGIAEKLKKTLKLKGKKKR